MRKLAVLPLLFSFAACAHIPFFNHARKAPAPPPEPPPNARRAQKVSSVVTPAPDFTLDAVGKDRTLRGLRGQAVVVVYARDAKVGLFKKQLFELAPLFEDLASKHVIFVAALQNGSGPVKSNIPFVMATDGAAVAARFNFTQNFGIAIIGQDGNIDYETTKVLPGGRVRDVVQNSFVVQDNARKR